MKYTAPQRRIIENREDFGPRSGKVFEFLKSEFGSLATKLTGLVLRISLMNGIDFRGAVDVGEVVASGRPSISSLTKVLKKNTRDDRVYSRDLLTVSGDKIIIGPKSSKPVVLLVDPQMMTIAVNGKIYHLAQSTEDLVHKILDKTPSKSRFSADSPIRSSEKAKEPNRDLEQWMRKKSSGKKRATLRTHRQGR